MLKPMSKESTKNLAAILEYCNFKDHTRIDNTNGTFKPLVVEVLNNYQQLSENGDVTDRYFVSLCHYGKLNGDPMRDPDVTLVVNRLMREGQADEYTAYPCEFQNDYIGVYNQVVEFDATLKPVEYSPSGVQSLVSFAGTFLSNIRAQQGI